MRAPVHSRNGTNLVCMAIKSTSISEEHPELTELYSAIMDNYYGLGATPRTALEGVADDLKHGRLTSAEALDTLSCTIEEMLTTIAYIVEHLAQFASNEMVAGYGRGV